MSINPPIAAIEATDMRARQGMLMALLAYAMFTCSDTAIKGLHGALSPFEVSFVVAVFTTATVLLVRWRSGNWTQILGARHPLTLHARALAGMGSGVLGVYAIGHVPFAEAYGLVYTGPILMTILAVIFFAERQQAWRWLAVLVGFVGVLLVVRPDFHSLQLGHLAALGTALCNAIAILLLRRIASDEAPAALIGIPLAYALVINGAASLVGFVLPSPEQLLLLAISGIAVAGAQLSLIGAAKRIAASRIAPTQYTPVVWATFVGLALYGEVPSFSTICGLVLITGTGLAVLATPGRSGNT